MKKVKFHKSNPREQIFPRGTKKQLQVGDCVVRAIVHVTEYSYKKVFRDLTEYAMHHPTCQPINFPDVYDDYIKERLGGLKCKPKRKADGKTYKVNRFPASAGEIYIIKTTKHLTAIVDGLHLDSWNCGEQRANTYWKIDKNSL